MGLRALAATSGSPDHFRIPWASFVQLVLDLTVQAYCCMRRDGVACVDWEEDTFTVRFAEEYLGEAARRHPLNLAVMARTKVHTVGMKSGDVSAKAAKEIDIRLFDSYQQNYTQVYFAWECKRVGDKRVNPRHAMLVREYVGEGMLRFVDGDYSAGLADAGMLGYVLAGEVANIVGDINTSMCHPKRARRLSTSDHLQPVSGVPGFSHAYRSQHTRSATDGIITLHHLFLQFGL